MERCKHGDMVRREGEKNGKKWVGWFCSTPKGTPDQCAPIFERSASNGSGGYYLPIQSPKPLESRPSASGSVLLPVLESILSELRKINANLEKDKSDEIPTSEIPF